MGKTSVKEALRALSKKALDKDDLWQTFYQFSKNEWTEESHDRSCVLVLSSILEQGLEISILSHCVKLDESKTAWLFGGQGGEGSLTFAQKIRLCFALGIYNQQALDDIEMVRHIRNLFAHSKGRVSFSDKEVVSAVEEFHLLKGLRTRILKPEEDTVKRNFIEVTRFLYNYFAIESRKKRPLSYHKTKHPLFSYYSLLHP